ncbi:hypothetical protein Ndes2437B_g01901 [Nannochloris sp. 'desiccata']
MTFRGLARKFHSSAPRFTEDGIINLAGQLVKNPLFQFGGVLVSSIYYGASFLHGEIKSAEAKLEAKLESTEAKLEAKLEADRKEAAVDRRQMQATLNEILKEIGSLKVQRRSWW